MKSKQGHMTRPIILLCALLLVVTGAGLLYGSRYIHQQLLLSGKSTATDIALLVKNNFQITDDEVAYMKTLTFNEMEVDPINVRLMDVGDGVALNAAVRNVYLLAPLSEAEYRYCPDQESADALGFSTDDALNGVWLLNGKIGEDGSFEPAQRDDIYRYTVLDDEQARGMQEQEAFGTLSRDSWGSFITGYAPIYTVEGSFVGLLGIDMDPDPYQDSAGRMSSTIMILLAAIMVVMLGVFVAVYFKYTRALEDQRRFRFFSEMSHEMRTPMNGILGFAALSKSETDVDALHHNAEMIETSGRHLIGMINKVLDYRQDGEAAEETKAAAPEKTGGSTAPKASTLCLEKKRILLCEDHPINAEITRRMVEKMGGTITVAQDGAQGLALFLESEEGTFDAVLMDVRMPVMDGLEATRRMRKAPRADARAIPIIALTANSYAEDVRATQQAGMNAHLTKPIEPQAFYDTLTREICKREQTKE